MHLTMLIGEKEMNDTKPIRVTILFNVGLTIALGFFAFLRFLFDIADKPQTNHNISRLPLIQNHIGLEITFGIVAGMIGILLLIILVKELWNRILVRFTNLSEITYTETYSIVIFVICLKV